MRAGLIGLSLFIIRFIAAEFRVGTTTETHPVGLLVGLLLFSGLVWLSLIPVLKKYLKNDQTGFDSQALILSAMCLGIGFRALFIGSTPIYEDDWNRYLWDGVVVTQGVSPYAYSPQQITDFQTGDFAPNDSLARSELQILSRLSSKNSDFVERINNPHLTTIYPPVAQSVFTFAAVMKPLSLVPLQGLYLLSEILVFILLLKALKTFGRSALWLWLYALNPILVFTAFNGAHMDILLVPFILLAILCVAHRPVLAAFALACAVSVKIWPLILGPLLFRSHNRPLWKYVVYGGVLALLSLMLLWPMIIEVKEGSGLKAYSEGWQRSSFLFPLMQNGLEVFTAEAPRLARVIIAILIGGLSLGIGLKRYNEEPNILFFMFAIITLFFLLSPTGFPWYVIWFVFFLPFIPSYGVGLLCVTVSLYYCRFWLGERDLYNIYLHWIVPLQFGLPIVIILFELFWRRRHDRL